MRSTALLLAVSLAPAISAQSELTSEQKLADLEVLTMTIQKRHPEPFHAHAQKDFDERVAALRAQVATLDDTGFFLAMRRIVALLEDGHSALVPVGSPAWPLAFRCFSDGIYVVASDARYTAALGGRLEKLDGVPIATVLERLTPLVSADNPQSLLVRIEQMLRFPRELHGAGILHSVDMASMTVTVDGHVTEVPLGAADPSSPPFFDAPPKAWKRCEPPADKTPLRLQHEGSKYWFTTLAAGKVAYLCVRAFENEPRNSFSSVCKELAAAMREGGTERLLIDLRGNPGGNNGLNQPLLNTVLDSAVDHAGGVYVLTDGATFSAAVNCASRLERQTWALFVGEPPGGRPNHFGDAKPTPLPNSGWLLFCSTLRWQDSDPEDHRSWTLPDLPVATTFADWVAGRDPVLDAAIAHHPTEMAGYTSSPPLNHWLRASQAIEWKPALLGSAH